VSIVGVFLPGVSAWAFAFVPLHRWIGDGAVRLITLGIAVVLPIVVGAITRWVAGSSSRGSRLQGLLTGYPLTVGYAVACLVTAVTVPLVKAASALRGWLDEHVYVQPRDGEYTRALEELAKACGDAGYEARVERMPRRMTIATDVLHWFARAAVQPIVSEEPRMVRAEGLELYLYPADLLIRGKREKAARVRAALTRSWLERFAFTVSDPRAQDLQEQIQGMWHMLRRHRDPRQIGAIGVSRLREIGRDLEASAIPYTEWVTLDRSLHRLERALGGGEDLLHDDAAVHALWNGGERSREERGAGMR
jgi:hypothetical protein